MNSFLPNESGQCRLIGRINTIFGPTPIFIENGNIFDISQFSPTISQFVESYDGEFSPESSTQIGKIGEFDFSNPNHNLLSPIDLQCIKACGVTFAVSAIERVIEERAMGDYNKAQEIRNSLAQKIGASINNIAPGSREAEKLKQALIIQNMWSQYLEVAIGKDAEVFTKAPVLSSVGYMADIGIRSDSVWSNSEPEVALIVSSKGNAIGATLANDVNLRCFEGRSALLLGKAKDNNASCSLGPFIRLFDDYFTLDTVRNAQIGLSIKGIDGFELQGQSNMSLISRDPSELIAQVISQHQYPDGFALLMGTMFAPTKHRGETGKGFTHQVGDIVTISNEYLGKLTNQVVYCNDAANWEFGIADLFQNLARRGLFKN